MKNKGLFVVAILLSLIVLVAGMAGAQEKKLTFYYVDHGNFRPGYPFWPQYYRGIEDATKMLAPLGVVVKHLSAGEQDTQTQEQMLRQAVEANPDGLVTTMRDPKSYEAILQPLIAKGVPIMAANVDDPRPLGERIPYLSYYGSDLRTEGTELAEAVIAHIDKTGTKKPQFALLVSPVADSRAWDEILKRFGERLAKEYGTKYERISDIDGNQMGAYVTKHPEVDLLCAHESWTWYRYISQLRNMGRTPGKDITVACVDASASILQYVKNGEVAAAYDEQQYLQGFLPLFDLYLYFTKGKLHPVSVFTGLVVDQSNAGTLQEAALGGYR